MPRFRWSLGSPCRWRGAYVARKTLRLARIRIELAQQPATPRRLPRLCAIIHKLPRFPTSDISAFCRSALASMAFVALVRTVKALRAILLRSRVAEGSFQLTWTLRPGQLDDATGQFTT